LGLLFATATVTVCRAIASEALDRSYWSKQELPIQG
jgi:hypothetical protein